MFIVLCLRQGQHFILLFACPGSSVAIAIASANSQAESDGFDRHLIFQGRN